MTPRTADRFPLLALLTALIAALSIAAEPTRATSSIGGVGIGTTKSQLAHLGAPTVSRTGDALDPEWRFTNGLVVFFWSDQDGVAQVESHAPSVCTDTGVCPGDSAARLNELLGSDMAGEYASDGEHQYPAAYDTCWLDVAVSDGVVQSIALACQP